MIAFAAMCIAAPCSHAAQPEAYPSASYMTGNDYRRLNIPDRNTYITGVMDGFLGAYMLDIHAKSVKALAECTKAMQIDQVRAIAEKYMAGHAAQWDWPMNMLTFNSLLGACSERGNPVFQ